MSTKRALFVVVLIVAGLLMSGFQQTDPLTTVQSVNTFLNIGQFGMMMYLLYRSDNALMRQRTEQASERKWLIGLLVGKTDDEK